MNPATNPTVVFTLLPHLKPTSQPADRTRSAGTPSRRRPGPLRPPHLTKNKSVVKRRRQGKHPHGTEVQDRAREFGEEGGVRREIKSREAMQGRLVKIIQARHLPRRISQNHLPSHAFLETLCRAAVSRASTVGAEIEVDEAARQTPADKDHVLIYEKNTQHVHSQARKEYTLSNPLDPTPHLTPYCRTQPQAKLILAHVSSPHATSMPLR